MNHRSTISSSGITVFVISLLIFLASLPMTVLSFYLIEGVKSKADIIELYYIFFAQCMIISVGSLAICFISLAKNHNDKKNRSGAIQRTADAMKKAADGDFSAQVEIRCGYDPCGIGEAFNEMMAKVRTLDTMRADFMCNVSHDMKTPMTVINGYVSNILNGSIPREDEEKYLLLVKKEIMRLSGLVGTLLYISRIESGDLVFDMKEFDICECARVAIISLCDKIEDKNFDFSFDCDNDNIYAVGDREAIEKVIINLLENAVKFTPRNGKITVCAKELNKTVTFSVYNEGAGIDKEDEPFVFDRFFKADKSRGLEKDAFGLGLFIGQQILKAHDSEIKLQNVSGQSCRFTFTLPTEGES